MGRKKKHRKLRKRGVNAQCGYCGGVRNVKGHCHGSVEVYECTKCFRIVGGRKECIGCRGDFSTPKERIGNSCPLMNVVIGKTKEATNV